MKHVDTCECCNKPLKPLEIIVAAQGMLFCSDECCKKSLVDFTNHEDIMEYVATADIGVQ